MTAVGFGLRSIYRTARNVEKTLDAVTISQSHVATALLELAEIKKEVKTNGGSSLKDAVNRIDRRVAVLEALSPDHVRGHIEATLDYTGHSSQARSPDEPHRGGGEGNR